jgi:hypothetical protein
VRAGSGGAEEPIKAGVAPAGSLDGMRRSEKVEVLERACAKRSGG